MSSPVSVQPFSQSVGPTVPLPESPLDIFSLLFTPQIVDHLVCQTNRYAQQTLADTNKEWNTNSEGISGVHNPDGHCSWARDTGLLVQV